jgi:hypothetical protein
VNLDELRADFLELVRDLHEHKERMEALIVEHRATVNRTLTLLYQDLESDRVERRRRQKRSDIKDGIIGAIGCLVMAIGLSMVVALFWLLWRIAP